MINILLTCAGAGKRFSECGYDDPKPFVDVNGIPMIELIIQNLISKRHHSHFHFILIFLNEHLKKYGDELNRICTDLCYKYTIIGIDKLTEGAAVTALFAESLINNHEQLILSDSDHICGDKNYLYNGIEYFDKYKMDGGFYNFISSDPKYSYVKVNGKFVTEVAEKITISNISNVGVYYYRMGSMFVKYAKEIIKSGIKIRGEHYVSTVATPAIVDGYKFGYFMVSDFIGLGTPTDLKSYLESIK